MLWRYPQQRLWGIPWAAYGLSPVRSPTRSASRGSCWLARLRVYNDPSLLWNAQNTVVPVTLGINGNVLSITPDPSFTGVFVVIASVNDGHSSASRAFKVTVS